MKIYVILFAKRPKMFSCTLYQRVRIDIGLYHWAFFCRIRKLVTINNSCWKCKIYRKLSIRNVHFFYFNNRNINRIKRVRQTNVDISYVFFVYLWLNRNWNVCHFLKKFIENSTVLQSQDRVQIRIYALYIFVWTFIIIGKVIFVRYIIGWPSHNTFRPNKLLNNAFETIMIVNFVFFADRFRRINEIVDFLLAK